MVVCGVHAVEVAWMCTHTVNLDFTCDSAIELDVSYSDKLRCGWPAVIHLDIEDHGSETFWIW